MIAIPMLFLIIFRYIPMVGNIIAFKNYNFADGIFGSPWVGFDNFKTFLRSRELVFLFRNTIGYNILMIITGMIAALFVALFLYELKSRTATKIYQTIMITPNFLSIIIVGYITYSLLNPQSGVFNTVLRAIGFKGVDWYSELWVWPFILPVVSVWKGVGMSSVMYYAALMGIDASIFEAAEIDGANKWQRYIYVLIPSILPTIVILLVLNLGSILEGDFGLFYYIPRNVGKLRPVTEIFSTYTMRLFKGTGMGVNYSLSTAISLFQSLVGMILTLLANKASKLIDKELGLF
ncbi:MAG: sugar ABC transporter permease [Clostridia bacterium]|nr:sugar ABC transporter permease [Clostridia bacterium]MBQ6937752.1 sugar ABC transporter permease [Clostridia bacterium]MBR2884940.1 sugar ABC transporter permease [Clostridia bacterium]